MTVPPRLVLASFNPHKLTELRAILCPNLPGVDPESIVDASGYGADDIVEDGTTFEENALIKAREVARRSNLPAIADDSGLCVDVLGGAPGVFSARWAGTHGDDQANLNLLLSQLSDVAPADRKAAFTCAAAIVTPDGQEHVEVGVLPGTLTVQPRGTGGFGYDPIFIPETGERTMAELSAEEKNSISHRGRAFRALAPYVAQVLGV